MIYITIICYKMGIFNVDEVIYHLFSLLSYHQLNFLTNINKKYYKIGHQMIKSYSEENLIKDLKIRIIMSNYHGKLLNVYNIEKYNFYESSVVVYHNTAIITCYPDIKINTLIKTFTKNTNITVSNISFDKSLIIFKLKFTKEKFNLIEVIKKTKMINSKDIKINNIPFRIYNNGQFKVI